MEQAKWQRVIPIMNQILQEKGLVKIAEGKILVTGLKGPLEEGWQKKVEDFSSQIPILPLIYGNRPVPVPFGWF